MRTKKE